MTDKKISLSDLEEYLKLQRLEQKFRLRLMDYKRNKEIELALVRDLKIDADALKAYKEKFRRTIPKDPELDTHIRNILKKTFDGLEI
jgi:hypothetical protein